MILTCFFHQTLNRYFSYIRNKEKKIRKIWPLKVYSNLNEVAGDRPNLFVKWRVRYIENLDITNLRGKDQNVHYIETTVNQLMIDL